MDYLIANRTRPTEWPLYTILSVHDSWMNTGSTSQLVAQYDKLSATLPYKWPCLPVDFPRETRIQSPK